MVTQRVSFLRVVVLVCIFNFVVAVSISRAQERQIPFDSAGKIMEIDKGLERSLHLFPEDEYFVVALLFLKPDESYTVEITRDSSHAVSRTHMQWTQSVRDSMMRRIAELTRQEHPELYLNQEGRSALMWNIMVLSLCGYSPTVPIALGINDGDQIAGSYLLFGGGSYLLSSAITSKIEVTNAEATFATTGAILGDVNGLLLTLALEGDDITTKSAFTISSLVSVAGLITNYQIAKDTKMTSGEATFATSGGALGIVHGALISLIIQGDKVGWRSTAGIASMASIGELIAGFYIARNSNMTSGTASVITTGGVYGGLHGIGLGYLIADITHPKFSTPAAIRLSSSFVLATSVAGCYLGNILSKDHSYSDGDAIALGLAAGLGGAIPLANLLAKVNNIGDPRVVVGITMAGSVLASYAAHEATRYTSFTSGQGFTLYLGTVAGGLTGLGIALLGRSDFQSGLLISSIGTVAGYGITFASMAGSHRSDSPARSHDEGLLDVRFNPIGIVTALHGGETSSPFLGITWHI